MPPEQASSAGPMPQASPAWSGILDALLSPMPGHFAVYRWLPQVWDPGRESFERHRLETFFRAEGWTLVSETEVGDPVAGVFYLFRRR